MQNNQNLKIGTIAGLISAAPALLGHIPADGSTLLVFLGEDRHVVAVVRVDQDAVSTVAPQLTPAIEGNGITAAAVIVVGGEMKAAAHEASELVLSLGLTLRSCATATAIEYGATWENILTGETGIVDDPRLTDVAMATAVRGQRLAESRDEIDAELRPHRTPKAHPFVAANTEEKIKELAQHTVDAVVEGRRDGATYQVVAAALTHGTVRDVVMGLIHTEAKDAARTYLVDVARSTGSGDAFACAAISFLAVNETVRAGIAADYALTADSENNLARLAQAAVARGMVRAAAEGVALTGLDVARRIGVQVPE